MSETAISSVPVDSTPAVVARPDTITLAAFVLGIFLAGGNAVAVRMTVSELAPFWGAFLRLGAAAVIFWLFVLLIRPAMPRGRALQGVLLYGIFNFALPFAVIFWALQTLPAGLGQVVLSLTPLLTFLLAVLHGMERFRWRGVFGALLAIVGITIVFYQQPSTSVSLIAVLAMAVAAASYAEATVLVKVFPQVHPIATNATAMSLAAVILFVLSWLAGESRTFPEQARTYGALVYLVLVGTVSLFLVTIFVIRRWTASAAAYMLVFIPFVTVTLAALIADEPLSLALLLGVSIAALGVWIGTFARPRNVKP